MKDLFDIANRVVVVTGGSGVLGRSMAQSLARAGANVVVIGRNKAKSQSVAQAIRELGGEALGLAADVLSREDLEAARSALMERFGRVDVLINAAGGNLPGATLNSGDSIFDLSIDAFTEVTELNLTGTVLPTLIFAEPMLRQSRGSIINISSMAAARALTRVVGYSSAKSAVENFTRWMAVELARKHGEGFRVNAIAPGFIVTGQNRDLLLNTDGALTTRGQTIIKHTPMGRFSSPEELNGTVHWLCSDASAFVTGAVIPVDGGFSAFSGV